MKAKIKAYCEDIPGRIGAIKTAITDTDLSTSIDKALLRKAIEELELWCREIGQ